MRPEFGRLSQVVRRIILDKLNELPIYQSEAPDAQVISKFIHDNGDWVLQAFLIRAGATPTMVNSALGGRDAVDKEMMGMLSYETWYFAKTTLNYGRADETEILHSRQQLLGSG